MAAFACFVQVLINCRNNKKLLGRVKAFDRSVAIVCVLSFASRARHTQMRSVSAPGVLELKLKVIFGGSSKRDVSNFFGAARGGEVPKQNIFGWPKIDLGDRKCA